MTDRLDDLYRVADAFAVRFPEGNGPWRILARLTEELGEVSAEVARLEGSVPKIRKHGVADGEDLAAELEDLLHNVCALARHYGIEDRLDRVIAESRAKADDSLRRSE